jgi:hypothetical protein
VAGAMKRWSSPATWGSRHRHHRPRSRAEPGNIHPARRDCGRTVWCFGLICLFLTCTPPDPAGEELMIDGPAARLGAERAGRGITGTRSYGRYARPGIPFSLSIAGRVQR